MGAGAIGPMTPSTELLIERVEQELDRPADGTDVDNLNDAQEALAKTRDLLRDANQFGKDQMDAMNNKIYELENELREIRAREQQERDRLLSQAPPELFGELKHENALLRQELEARTQSRNALLKKATDPNFPGVQTNYSRRRKDMPQVKRASDALLALQDEIFEDPRSGKPIEAFRERYDGSLELLQTALRNELGRQVGCDKAAEVDTRAPAALLRLAEVLYPSNKRYLQYYFKAYRAVKLNESEDLEGVSLDASTIPTTGVLKQASGDGLLMMMQAAKAQKKLETMLDFVNNSCEADVDPSYRKTFYRLVERAATIGEDCRVNEALEEGDKNSPLVLNYKYDWCCSFIRGKVTAPTMKKLRDALQSVLKYRDDGMIVIDYVRDRFVRPTAAGWRDLVLGFHFADDEETHILEVQFMHQTYATVAEELGSEESYDKGRAAVEGLHIASHATRFGNMTPLISFHCNVIGREIAVSNLLMSDDPWKGWGANPDIEDWEGIMWESRNKVDFWSTAIKFLGRFDDEAYHALCAYGMPALTEIDVTSNRTIVNDDIISVIAETTPTLRSVNLSGCTKITDVGVTNIAKYCTHLQLIDLSHCMLVTDAGIDGLTTHAGKSLESIEMRGDKALSDVSLVAIGRDCSNLKYLGCHSLNKITDVGVEAIAQGCPALNTLDLSFTSKITDASLGAIGRGLTSLRFLSVRSDARITDGGIKPLSDGCSLLEMLDCSLCSKIRDASIEVLESRENLLLSASFKGCVWISDLTKYSGTIELPRLQFKDGGDDDADDDIDHAILAQTAAARRNTDDKGTLSPEKSAGVGVGMEQHYAEGGEEKEGHGSPGKGHSKDLDGELRPPTVSKTMRAEALMDGI